MSASSRTFPLMLRLVREAHGLTQTELAVRTRRETGRGLTQGRIAEIEAGRTNVGTDIIEDMAAGLGLTTLEFCIEGVAEVRKLQSNHDFD